MSEKFIDTAVRVGVIVASVALALVVQLVILGPPCRPDDWLKLIALTFAAHASLQLILRYSLLPDPQFRLSDAAAKPLGPPLPISEAGLEGDVLREVQHANRLRDFLIQRVDVEHRDAARWVRALGSRAPVEGAVVRFRYRPGGSQGIWTDWRVGRWDDVLQPLQPSGAIDLRAVETNHRLPKLYPSDLQDPERLWRVAFAMKKEGAAEFYHFNDRSYLYPPDWRNPDWVLPAGVYEVEAELAGYGLSHKQSCGFWLICSATEFRITTRCPRQANPPQGSTP